MRIVEQRHRDGSSSALEMSKAGTVRMATRHASRDPVVRALSWLMARVIEGLAVCGETMYPDFVTPREHIDRHRDGPPPEAAPCSQNELDDVSEFSQMLAVAPCINLGPPTIRPAMTGAPPCARPTTRPAGS